MDTKKKARIAEIVNDQGVHVVASGEGAAWALRVSPNAALATYWVFDEPSESRLHLRCVNLETKETFDSPVFRTEDVTFDGAPLFYWHEDNQSVFSHVSMANQSKTPFQLTRYDFFKSESIERE